jgi:hypothetical protein
MSMGLKKNRGPPIPLPPIPRDDDRLLFSLELKSESTEHHPVFRTTLQYITRVLVYLYEIKRKQKKRKETKTMSTTYRYKVVKVQCSVRQYSVPGTAHFNFWGYLHQKVG